MIKYTCQGCSQVKDISKFLKSSNLNHKLKRGRCLRCHAEYNANHYQEKQIKKYPNRYMYCNNCDRSFYRYTKLGKTGSEQRTKCRHCDSEDVGTYT